MYKIETRNKVNEYKKEYNMTNNEIMLLQAAIHKGLYLALGGKKGIALSNKVDDIVYYSTIIFKYKIKIQKSDCNERNLNFLFKNMRENFKSPEYYLSSDFKSSNEQLAGLLADIITLDKYEDIVINYKNIYDISLDILESL